MKTRLKLATILTPAIFFPLFWLYPHSIGAGASSLWQGLAFTAGISFMAAYSVAMFAHALRGER